MPSSTRSAGRPREFDVDEALNVAMRLFWQQGYEGTSVADLSRAMGITKTSLYAAFGNKEQLFRTALAKYTDGPAAYAARALEQPTVDRVVEALLEGAVRTTTKPNDPHGCMGVQGALATNEQARPAHDVLVAWRIDAGERLRERFERAVVEGDLPADANPEELARFVMTLTFGIAVQAASGVGRDDLQAVASLALKSWRA